MLSVRSFLVLVVSSCAALLPGYSCAKPITDFKLEHYTVTGSTIAEIKMSMARNSPIRTAKTHFGGVTVWNLETAYQTRELPGGGCEVLEPQVYLKIKIVLPKLVPGKNITPQVLNEWNRFLGALRAHELLHAKNGVHAANVVEQRMTNLKTGINCARTKDTLNQATHALINNIAQRDRDMDKQTNHGATQGAYLDDQVDFSTIGRR